MVILLVIVLFLLFHANYKSANSREYVYDNAKFKKDSLRGVILGLKSFRGLSIRVDNDSSYEFNYKQIEINDKRMVSFSFGEGDSIIKKADNDTFYIVRNKFVQTNVIVW